MSLALLSVAPLVGCEDGSTAPQVASSSAQTGYALRYPDEVSSLHQSIETEEQTLGTTKDELAAFPDALNEPDWAMVASIYEQAHEEGKGQAYAQRHEESRVVNTFFEQEKKPIVGRVAGGVQHSAKEEGCADIKPHGAVSFSLERAIEQQLEDRTRGDSTAHLTIDENEDALGKKNLEPLHEQADKLAAASHAVYVRLATDEQELARLVDEGNRVRSTLEARKESLNKAEKPDTEAIAEVDAALATLDEELPKAQESLKNAEQRTQQLQNDYVTAYNALMEDVKKRAKDAAKEAPKE